MSLSNQNITAILFSVWYLLLCLLLDGDLSMDSSGEDDDDDDEDPENLSSSNEVIPELLMEMSS